jgi:hypothetical protein
MRSRNLPTRTGTRRTWDDITREARAFWVDEATIAEWAAVRRSIAPWPCPTGCEALSVRDPGRSL